MHTTQDDIIWFGKRMVQIRHTDARPAGRVFDPRGRITEQIYSPPRSARSLPDGVSHFVDGFFYFERFFTLEQTPEGRRCRTIVQRYNPSGKSWTDHAVLISEKGTPPRLIPMTADRFLGLATSFGGIQSSGKPYPFGVYLRDEKGYLHLESVHEAQLKQPIFSSNGKFNYPVLQFELMAASYAVTEDYLIVGSSFGYFWVFDREKGRLRRLVKLYAEADEGFLTSTKPVQTLLGFHPTPEGDLLIASRTKEALVQGSKSMAKPRFDPGGPMNLKLDADWADSFNATYPLVTWWVLNPGEGTLHERPAPPRTPKAIFSQREAIDFNWRFLPNGEVVMVTRAEHLQDLPPPGESLQPVPRNAETRKR